MKKIFYVAAFIVAACFASCTGKAAAPTFGTTVDTLAVDSVAVDTVVVDSAVVDSAVVDSVVVAE